MRNRLSYTAVETYLRCPKEYYLHYIGNLREETTGSALVFGNAMDAGLNALLQGNNDYQQVFKDTLIKNKTKSVRYSKSDIDESLVSFVPSNLEELLQKKTHNLFNEEDQAQFNDIAFESLLAKGKLIIEAYKEQVMPLIKRVISVQKTFSLSNEEGDQFIGFIDLIAELHDGRIVVFDNKTTSVKYAEDSVKNSKQLATYLISEGNESTLAGFIAVHKKILKREPRVKIQVIIDNVDESVINSTFDDYDKVNNLIKDGEFPRNNDSCIRVWGKCPFYGLCKNNDKTGLIDTSKEKKDD